MTPKKRRHMGMIVAGLVIAFAATAGVWAALQGSPATSPTLAAMLPQGALLTIETKNFAGLLKRWNDSPEKAAWLKSDNLSVFSRSRLFGRLGDAQNEFAQAAGLPPDMSFLNEVAGGESVFAWYDIGKLEFLYITRMPASSADKTRLAQMRGKFATRQAGNQTFYVRTQTDQNQTDQNETDQSQGEDSQGQARTVAFATSGDWLLLATREDLMAGALTLMAAHTGNSAPADSLAAEPWYVDARAAAPRDAGELRMTLNLQKIVPSPYFRSYWVQRNVTEMKQYRSAVADLYMDSDDFREERVLLPKAPLENSASAPNLDALVALLPQHAGVYRAVAAPGVDAVLDSINEKLLLRTTGGFTDMRVAPDADVSVHEVGSTTDFETRIDAAPLAHPVRGAELEALRQALAIADPQAMMTVSRTGDARDGIWIPFQSAVVLSAATDWDIAAMQAALQRAFEAHITAGSLGLAWKSNKVKGGSYAEVSDSRPLEMAVRGKLCILADDAGLMQEILGQTSDAGPRGTPARKLETKSDAPGREAPATLIAGFNLAQERASFARWSSLVDKTSAGPTTQNGEGSAGGSGGEPSFFSRNMRSLGDVFAALESERVVERGDGDIDTPDGDLRVAALRRRTRLALRRGAAGLGVLIVSLAPLRLQAQETSSSFYGQAASAMLSRSFPSPGVEYLLLDLRTRQTLAVRWADVDKPIPVGSLLKPFVALAYGELHVNLGSPELKPSRQFPVLRCRGKSDGCWRAGGHGSMALEEALEQSCNAYFLALARDLSASEADSGFSDGLAAMSRVSASYGLPAPPAASSLPGSDEQRIPRMLIGVTPEWRVSPVALAHAYATLAGQPESELASLLLSGMRLAAGPQGTAAKIGRHPGGVLAKTGTAPCVPGRDAGSERCIANGDGLAVALTPAENPRLLLLVRQRGTTGAQAAEVAGQMLSRLEEPHAPAR